MARLTKTSVEDVNPPTGVFTLPDPAGFAPTAPTVIDDPNSVPGRVIGLDYAEWAAATIDLTGRPDRVAAQRLRYQQKGYQRLDGQPIVVGVPSAEVWIKPRSLWLAAKDARRRTIAQHVRSGVLSESALAREVTVQG